MINKVILIGNLGADAVIHPLKSGAKVAKFGMATSEKYKDKNGEWQETTEWHDVILWGNLAERADQLKKGSKVYVEGKLTYRKYTPEGGVERTITEIKAATVRILDKKEQAQTAQPVQSASVADPIGDDDGSDLLF